ADVGQAEFVAQHGARDVDALEALLLDEAGAQGGEGTREALQLAGGEALTQAGALLGRGLGGVEHQKIPLVVLRGSSALMVRPQSSSAASSGRRWATSRKRSISSGSSTPFARVRNLATYCSRPNGRAPSGWASATR